MWGESRTDLFESQEALCRRQHVDYSHPASRKLMFLL